MDYASATSFTAVERQQLHQGQFERELVYQQRIDERALLLPFIMNRSSLDMVRACFLHRRVYVDQHADYRASHPVPASLLWYCRQDLHFEFARVNRLIDLGGNLIDTLTRHTTNHACLMYTSARDRNRYLASLYSKIHTDESGDVFAAVDRLWKAQFDYHHQDLRILHSAATTANIETNDLFCLGGAQHCNHRADVMISIHSLYDMTPDDVIRMFETHGAHTMVAWAFFPPELFNEFDGSDDVRAMGNVFNWYSIRREGDNMVMAFNDSTFYYRHNRANWARWLKLNRLRARNFDVIIEIQEQVGIMFKLRFTRTPTTGREIIGHEIHYNFLSDYIRVPDVYHYIETREIQYSVCPRVLVNRIFNHALKSAEVNANSIHTLAASCVTRIDISDVVVNKFVDISAFQLDVVAYSCILLASAHRARRTRDFQLFVDLFKLDLAASGGVFSSIHRKLVRLFDDFKRFVGFGNLTPDGVYDLALRPFTYINCVDEFIEHPYAVKRTCPVDYRASRSPLIVSESSEYVESIQNLSNVSETEIVYEQAVEQELPTSDDSALAQVIDDMCSLPAVITSVPDARVCSITNDCVDLPVAVSVSQPAPSYRAPRPLLFNAPDLPAVVLTPSLTPQPHAPVALITRKYGPTVSQNLTSLPPFTEDQTLAKVPDDQWKNLDRLLPSRIGPSTRAARKLMHIADHFLASDSDYNVLDVGAGPGAFGAALKRKYPALRIYGITFGIPISECNQGAYTRFVNADINHYDVEVLDPLRSEKWIIFDDIGGRPIFYSTYNAVLNVVRYLASPNLVYVIKGFTPSSSLDVEALRAAKAIVSMSLAYQLYRSSYSGEANHELYYICRGVCSPYFTAEDLQRLQTFYDDTEFARRAAVTHLCRAPFVNVYAPAVPLRDCTQVLTCERTVVDSFYAKFRSTAPTGLRLLDLLHVPERVRFRVLAAVPAAGKSRYLRGLTGTKLFIVPTNELAEAYRAVGSRVVTFHTYFVRPRPPVDHLVIDEAYTFRLPFAFAVAAHCVAKNYWLAGDPYQVGAIDFTSDLLFTQFPLLPPPDYYNTHSLGLPQDVAQFLPGLGYPAITTSSRIKTSMSFVDLPLSAMRLLVARFRALLVVYNQDTVDRLRLSDMVARTIHQVQGSRPTAVVFYLDEQAVQTGLDHALEHLRVVVSRHTQKLVFVGQTHHMRKIIDFYGSNIHLNLERYDIHMVDRDISAEMLRYNGAYTTSRYPMFAHVDPPVYGHADVDAATEILSHILPASTDGIGNFAALMNTTIPYHGDGRLVIKLDRLLEKMRDRVVPGYMSSHSQFAVRHFPSSVTALSCVMDRYTKVTPDSADEVDAVVSLFNALDRVAAPYENRQEVLITDDDFANTVISQLCPEVYNMLLRLRDLSHIEGMVEHHLVEYFRALDIKQIPRAQYDTLIADARDFWLNFFPKRQVKPSVKDGWDASKKAPQGIAAYDKEINMLFAAFSRMLSQFTDAMLRPNVIFASNHPETELSARVAAAYQQFDPDLLLALERAASDFSEYDSTQSRSAFMFMSVFYAVMGMPSVLLHRYRVICAKWVMTDDVFRLFGKLKFQSGSFETLVRNSWYGLANNCVVYRWDVLCLILFKGDDFELEGYRVFFRPGTWLRDNKLSIKDESPPVGEFAGKFILPGGTCPDVLRRSIKYLSTVYKSPEHHAESIVSLSAEFDCITSQAHLESAIAATVSFYTRNEDLKRPPNASDIRILFDFLHTRARSTDAQLFKVQLPLAMCSLAGATLEV